MSVSVASYTSAPELGSAGNYRIAVKNVTFDNAYPAGGEPILAKDWGMTRIRFGIANILTTAAAGNTVDICVVPQSDGSALLKCNAAAAQVGAVDLSTLVATVVLWGDA